MGKVICKIQGGFANQCLQYLFASTLAEKTNRQLILDISDYSFFSLFQKLKRNSVQKLFVGFKSEPLIRFSKDTFLPLSFSDEASVEELLAFQGKDIYLNGYWHSAEYIEFIDVDIKKRLYNKVLSHSSIQIEPILEQIFQAKTSISIHVRRGDYLKGKYKYIYGTCPISYYEASINSLPDHIKADCNVFVFSDDVKWVKENFTFLNAYYISANGTFLDDFILMMSCSVNIIANSSFSWLASQLNTKKGAVKISPSQWFKDKERSSLPLDSFSVIKNTLE
jgi:hypothetical protein